VLAAALGSIDALKSSSSNRATGDAIAPTAALHNALHKPLTGCLENGHLPKLGEIYI
jgi:hypothetical protein